MALKNAFMGLASDTVGCLPKRIFTGAPSTFVGYSASGEPTPYTVCTQANTCYRPGVPGPALNSPPDAPPISLFSDNVFRNF
ncbi:hypothetical protein N7455_012047 [Penicillium solitum]|uniref:uncharacterized protein n=1 Tax=Penicillium solitum TaxID=60172 RepID=UPI0017B55482|nr:hypothetical protein HAV15_012483 [Penicillium sp. str. \